MGEESVVADEPCEAASGCEAVVKSASTVSQALRVLRFCDRYALDRSLVLLVNCYTAFVAADEPCEAASGGEAVVNPDVAVNQEKLWGQVLRSLRRSGAPNRSQPRSTRQRLQGG